MMRAEIVRLGLHKVDLKIVSDDEMQVLQWRRKLFRDEVLLNGKLQAYSAGLWGREQVYGLVFGRDLEGQGGEKVMFMIDPSSNDWNWSQDQVRGVRLEAKDGPIVAYGSLDPKSLEKPATFSDWMKKTMGMEW
ncbi:MAG: hypothetical protein QNI84_09945 [Henriciella sp.]|nr:hypothetical protein [Henriciella sp.]